MEQKVNIYRAMCLLLLTCLLQACTEREPDEHKVGFYREVPTAIKWPNDVKRFERICLEDSCVFNIDFGSYIEPVEVSLSNHDSSLAVNLYFTREGFPDLSSNQAIINSIITTKMSDEEKAIALWGFICKWAFQAEPNSEESDDINDPVKFLNVYGYGFCDDLNGALTNLAKLVGFDSRYWGLNGHGVAEIYYDNSWHMFDASMGIYYRDENEEVAGVKYLEEHTETIVNSNLQLHYEEVFKRYFAMVADNAKASDLNVHDQHLLDNFGELRCAFREEHNIEQSRELNFELMRKAVLTSYSGFFESANDNSVTEGWDFTAGNHDMELTLHPSDEVIFRFYPLNPGTSKLMCYTNRDKCYETEGTLIRRLAANRENTSGSPNEIVYMENSPYAITAIHLDVSNIREDQSTEVYFSKDQIDWTFLGNLSKVEAGEKEIYYDLIEQFPGDYLYRYYLKFQGGEQIEEEVKFVTVKNEFIFSFLSVPHPSSDSSNFLLLSSWDNAESSSSQGVKVNFAWTESP